ncbi:pyridoxamine 5'-phosphate oxidase family protein [Streptomyces rectiverticillatus]|uniref:pyridoxamine 5'-phosphate oxidase family protein n=1 Tax=Streptomyces rectiverticillatus TaxID=173860 RepID=UPI0015C303E2|nr:pyridoxamine 5'-phosphate oxidase family protein [Streptomyces rectiverticillatus]QLE73103.1 pyridoxamine 5'-phosphate oxidase family protein [Streptomyces rectiverticillatus]
MTSAPRIRTFHEGERAVQRTAGADDRAARVAGILGDQLSPVAGLFLSTVSCVALGTADADGRMWATVLTGEAGFVQTGPKAVRICAARPEGDPCVPAGPLDQVALIAMDFVRRRRFRVNGRVRRWDPSVIEMDVDEAYGNCPRHIRQRLVDPAPFSQGPKTTRLTRLTDWEHRFIARRDTLFIATRHPEAGADVSHRGGPAGFLRVTGPGRVELPDYSGNALFNTLGNLWSHPGVGLVLPDFATGQTVQISGRATIDHRPPPERWGPEVERVVGIDVERVVRTTTDHLG